VPHGDPWLELVARAFPLKRRSSSSRGPPWRVRPWRSRPASSATRRRAARGGMRPTGSARRPSRPLLSLAFRATLRRRTTRTGPSSDPRWRGEAHHSRSDRARRATPPFPPRTRRAQAGRGAVQPATSSTRRCFLRGETVGGAGMAPAGPCEAPRKRAREPSA
jgi:hypothetical protein